MYRKSDALGRVVIPVEIRKRLKLQQKDLLKICLDNDKIIIIKIQKDCIFCHNENDLVNFQGFLICKICLSLLKKVKS